MLKCGTKLYNSEQTKNTLHNITYVHAYICIRLTHHSALHGEPAKLAAWDFHSLTRKQ